MLSETTLIISEEFLIKAVLRLSYGICLVRCIVSTGNVSRFWCHYFKVSVYLSLVSTF